MCKASIALYKCPECSTLTCSIKCVKKHKKDLECEGKHYVSKFIPLNNFSDAHLLTENINNRLEASNRNHYLHTTDLPKRVQLMKQFAQSQKIFLRIMSYGMTRHSENSTIFDMKTKKFLWHIKWILPHIKVSHHDKRVPEQNLIQDTLQDLLTHVNSISKRNENLNQVACSFSTDLTDYFIYMKNECRQTSKEKKWHILNPDKTLKYNLYKKVILEYPVFHVVPKSDIAILKAIYDPRDERFQFLQEEKFITDPSIPISLNLNGPK